MKQIIIILNVFFFSLSFSYAVSENSVVLDTQQIERLTGVKGEMNAESGVFTVTSPRENLKASAAGIHLTLPLGLASWVQFKPLSSGVEIRGDLLLLEDQVNLIMKEALDHGLNITSLHHNYLWETPKLMVMGIEGQGDLKDLTVSIGSLFEIIKKTTAGTIWRKAPAMIHPERSTLTSSHLEDFLDKKVKKQDGVLKFIWDDGLTGMNTWAAFAGTDRVAILVGEIVMKNEDVQNVLKILVDHNFFINSLRYVKREQDDKVMLVRYMGRGSALELVKILKETLEKANPIENSIEKTNEIHTSLLPPLGDAH